ncbi:predicted nucleotide kinase, CMP/AMP kinase [Candidatus Moduliflexus flocculans]|uniref:Predicted nucleotide kinase, CMP/AMP kinase n=1 Tax=Candidatus Moduliflexus flocculans TaxID=1499966 RepID=A0A0S6VQK9_9BACT|nr:predicted nucleotide kinase, CMP/AMP kinase [Candidatus Moduliflexus flocculans]
MAKSLEFLGIPGAGKTRVLNYTLAALREHDRRAELSEEAAYRALGASRSSRLLTVCTRLFPYRVGRHLLARFPRTADDAAYLAFQRFLQAHPLLSRIVLECHYAKPPDRFDFLSLFWFFDLFSTYQLVSEMAETHDDFVLFDEGFSQRVVTLFAYGEHLASSLPLEQAIVAYLEAIPCPDAIFALTAPVESVIARMEQRGFPQRMRTMTLQERERSLRQAEICVNLAKDALHQQGAMLFEIENSGTEADLRVQVAHAIEAWLA